MEWVPFILLALAAPYLRELLRRPMTKARRHDAPGEFLKLSQGVTHFQWHGPVRGPVVIAIHGLTTPSIVWKALIPGLSAIGFRTLTYDLYGRGYSGRPEGEQTRAFFLTQLRDLLESQDLEDDLILMGYSMGGSIATAFAAAEPDRVRRLILVAPAGIEMQSGKLAEFVRDTPVIGDWLMLALGSWRLRQGVMRNTGDPLIDEIGAVQIAALGDKGVLPAVLASQRGMLAETLEEEHRSLSRNDVPVLAIWGKQDAVIPIRALGTLAQWNRMARQDVIEGASHALPFTHPKEAGAFISEVLREG